MLDNQLAITVVPATALRPGDRIPVRFGGYGEVTGTVLDIPRLRDNDRIVDIVVAGISTYGPAFCTIAQASKTYTVLR